MKSSKVLLSVVAMVFTVLGGYKVASVYAASQNWRSGIMHKIQTLSEDDWNDPEKIRQLQQSCVDSSIEKLASFIGHLESELHIAAEQTVLWNELKASIQAEYQTIQLVCGKILTRENTENLPARLELMSALLASGQESLQRLTPAIHRLYGALDIEQQTLLEDMASRHHKRKGWLHH